MSLKNVSHAVLMVYALGVPSCLQMDLSTHFQSKLDLLRPGMTTSQVGETIGSPDKMVGEINTLFGQHVVVWAYEKFTSPGMKDNIFWVYLVDGCYVKHTPHGNWGVEKELIYHTEYPRFPAN